MLDVRNLQKIYTGRNRNVEALRNLTFHLDAGELVCLVGPSGCGKTTLLKCMAGLLAPTDGEVLLDGRPVDGPPAGMAVVFQEYGRSLFAWKNVRDNVALPLRRKKLGKARERELVDHALEVVGLADAHEAYPWQLSGGMQQRVAIARAVAYEPKVLLMDEPFAAVDAQTRAELEDLIRHLWRELGVTVLFVTHDIDEAVYLGQRTVILSKSPTVVQEDLIIDLPDERDQLHTRASPRFAELRAHVYEQIQRAKHHSGDTGTQVADRTPAGPAEDRTLSSRRGPVQPMKSATRAANSSGVARRMPRVSALTRLDPAPSPATTRLVFLDTLEEDRPPADSMSSFIWLRLSFSRTPVIAPVTTTAMPASGPPAGSAPSVPSSRLPSRTPRSRWTAGWRRARSCSPRLRRVCR